ncbi:NAD(P)H-hydrate dehydratase [Actinomyces vulturis]|uniref:NAD(P)H-hydrate dehydratase n=1 Tax=Actinomyces vulturis TaxID=1857645 RepID=UPI000B2B1D4C|nr:NAD(P)H-hydrate dehydratase [Actinomyces vulturis]
MMISGIDVVELESLAQRLQSAPGLVDRLLSAHEREMMEAHESSEDSAWRVQHIGGAFAVKEAVLKVFGQACHLHDLTPEAWAWADIEVMNRGGAPSIRLSGTARDIASQLGLHDWSVSLSHERSLALATAQAIYPAQGSQSLFSEPLGFDALDVAANCALHIPGPDDHKYSRGVVSLAVGSQTYPGAAVLCTQGAQGAGAGMVRVNVPDSLRSLVITACPEVVMTEGKTHARVIGCGISMEEPDRAALVNEWLDSALDPTFADSSVMPVVVDASALEPLAKRCARGDKFGEHVIITPHRAEAERMLVHRAALATSFSTTPSESVAIRTPSDAAEITAPLAASAAPATSHQVPADLSADDLAQALHEFTGCTVLLKGHRYTLINSSGHRTLQVGPAWLGTAGSGDVLAGILGALLATHHAAVGSQAFEPTDLIHVTSLACYLHGIAGHVASSTLVPHPQSSTAHSVTYTRGNYPGHPITAREIARELPHAWDVVASHQSIVRQ